MNSAPEQINFASISGFSVSAGAIMAAKITAIGAQPYLADFAYLVSILSGLVVLYLNLFVKNKSKRNERTQTRHEPQRIHKRK